jgi:hypothetical protein
MGAQKVTKISTIPIVFREGALHEKSLEHLRRYYKNLNLIDIYDKQVEELFEITYPNNTERKLNKSKFFGGKPTNSKIKGVWVFFPWNSTLVHMLGENDYYSLRTNRNRNLITKKEQKKLSTFIVGIAGLSIGSNIALTLVRLGINSLKISDFDTLVTSNLNRVPTNLLEIGVDKTELATRKLYEIDPFINLETFGQGLTKKTLKNFLVGTKKLNVVIDAIDDFEMKILSRLEARKQGIPVVMFTNLGDSCLLDIERYDKEKNIEIFNGLLGNTPETILKSKMTAQDKQKFAAKLVGVDNVPTKALDSLLEIGKTLVGRPQLSSTVSTSSGLAGFIIKKLALGEYCPSGRYLVRFETAIFSEKKSSKPYLSEPKRDKVISSLLKKHL